MHNPEALAQLAAEGADAAEWVNMINAIRAFYNQDFALMNELLNTVPDECTAGSLKGILGMMSGTVPAAGKLSYHEEKLVKRVTEDSRFLSSAIGQLMESIEYGEELFIETVSLLIKEVKKSPSAAERLALWSFKTCIDNNFDDEALADNIIMLFGQAEGLRLIGLSLLETEPESALICFTRSLIKRLVDRMTGREEAAAFLEIIGALISVCRTDAPVLLDISEILTMLESELVLFFTLDELPEYPEPAMRVSVMLESLIGSGTDNLSAIEHKAEIGEAIQLELF